ncbi:hypothetical protein GCK32_018108 [Trichostrongylus colubriformis]|uniref:Tyrosine specific protein phosphatases domain-containing protein n=1 Tax=Trichostrongylus colubriformis TaxID=6319 RepID=A0AAN8J3P6_TRICO
MHIPNFLLSPNKKFSGKIAVHCHAGHGRTGMVIAACLMLVRGMTPREAVNLVREKRPGSVQSSDQVQALHSLHVLLSNHASVLPTSPFRTTSEYVEFTARVLPRREIRRYGKVPKVLLMVDEECHVHTRRLIDHKCKISVVTMSHIESRHDTWRAVYVHEAVTEEMLHLMSVDVTTRGQAYYFRKVKEGINTVNLEKFLMVSSKVER